MYGAGLPVLWPSPPDWSSPVSETLDWLSDLMQASGSGAQQVRQLRTAPRRGFSFQCTDAADSRRILDAIRFDTGVSQFLLPIYPDVQLLAAPLAQGATTVPCDTVGFDFAVGAQVALWSDVNTWELGTVSAIAADSITLAAPTAYAWAAGTRLYPLRKARLGTGIQESQGSDDMGSLQVTVAIDEPCDWTPAWPSAATYRTLPVLEWRGDESTDPTDEYDRAGNSIDADTGPIYYFDLPNMPFRMQQQLFTLSGRADHTNFRALAYQLAGRCGEIWVPSWQADLVLAQAAAAADTQIQVAPCYYTAFGYLQTNRRDIRIELLNGTILYRRITGSAQTANGETLQLDSALGVAFAPADVRQIGFLTVCQLGSDTVQIDHVIDAGGVASATLNWVGVQNSV